MQSLFDSSKLSLALVKRDLNWLFLPERVLSVDKSRVTACVIAMTVSSWHIISAALYVTHDVIMITTAPGCYLCCWGCGDAAGCEMTPYPQMSVL